jgi:hypothetical protein
VNADRVAEVTLSFDDYAYNDPYARCLAKNDQAGIEWLKQSYLSSASQSLSEGQRFSDLALGRQIKHTILLHIGGFQTVMLPRLLDLFSQRGIKLITLQAAEADPAYAADPRLLSDWSGTFLEQTMRSKQIPIRRPVDERFAKLDALCR